MNRYYDCVTNRWYMYILMCGRWWCVGWRCVEMGAWDWWVVTRKSDGSDATDIWTTCEVRAVYLGIYIYLNLSCDQVAVKITCMHIPSCVWAEGLEEVMNEICLILGKVFICICTWFCTLNLSKQLISAAHWSRHTCPGGYPYFAACVRNQ